MVQLRPMPSSRSSTISPDGKRWFVCAGIAQARRQQQQLQQDALTVCRPTSAICEKELSCNVAKLRVCLPIGAPIGTSSELGFCPASSHQRSIDRLLACKHCTGKSRVCFPEHSNVLLIVVCWQHSFNWEQRFQGSPSWADRERI